MTGGLTAAYTQMTNPTSYSQVQQKAANLKSIEIASKIMTDKNFKLTEFIQYDTNLGREQNIELGKDSSLDPSKSIFPSGGVTLRQFAPDKYVPHYRSEKDDEQSFSEMDITPIGGKKFTGHTTANFSNTMHNSINGSQVLNFEEKMQQREVDEKKGKLFPRETIMTNDGGKL